MATGMRSKLKKWVIVAVIVCLLVIVIQNTESVRTQILFLSIEMPRFVLLALMLAIGFLVGLFLRDGKSRAEPAETRKP